MLLFNLFQALFVAYGPGFKKNFTAKPFENIELYNMMACELKKTNCDC